MKDILKMVYGDQKEVKLESQKIELGLIDDLSGISTAVNAFTKNIEIDIKELKEVKNSLNVDYNDLSSELSKLENTINKAEKISKELGVKVSDIKGYKDAVKSLKEAKVKLKEAEKFK
jgi:FtsZ-binding cell division protein ZapB